MPFFSILSRSFLHHPPQLPFVRSSRLLPLPSRNYSTTTIPTPSTTTSITPSTPTDTNTHTRPHKSTKPRPPKPTTSPPKKPSRTPPRPPLNGPPVLGRYTSTPSTTTSITPSTPTDTNTHTHPHKPTKPRPPKPTTSRPLKPPHPPPRSPLHGPLVLGCYTSTPIELFYFHYKPKIELIDYDKAQYSGYQWYDVRLGWDGRIYPTYKKRHYEGPNGAGLRPNGMWLQEVLRRGLWLGKEMGGKPAATIWRVPKGIKLPYHLILLHEYDDHFSLQTTKAVGLHEFNMRITDFLRTHAEKISREKFCKQYPLLECFSSSERIRLLAKCGGGAGRSGGGSEKRGVRREQGGVTGQGWGQGGYRMVGRRGKA